MISLLCLFLTPGAGGDTYAVNHARQIPPAQAVPSDTLITLERTGCEGACAIYRLKISADGVVIYEGKQFVRKRGKAKSKLTEEQLRQLISEFDRMNYFSMRDSYAHPEDGCAGSGIDYPSAITSIRISGRSKTIAHDYGCREKPADGSVAQVYPKELYELERRIDEIAGSKRWVR